MKKSRFLLFVFCVKIASYSFSMDDAVVHSEQAKKDSLEDFEQMTDRHQVELQQLADMRTTHRRRIAQSRFESLNNIRSAERRGELTSEQAQSAKDQAFADAHESRIAVDTDYDSKQDDLLKKHKDEISQRDPEEQAIYKKYREDKEKIEAEQAAEYKKVNDEMIARDDQIQK